MLDIEFTTQIEYFLRILGAVICGGIIGLERERRVKSAGLKTHMIVSSGAALMMIVSKYGFWDVLVLDTTKLDPSRVAAGIVSAIGFLGAGIIFTRGFKINGITTAAGLWTTVGIGMALGAGLYFISIATTLLILLIQLLFGRARIASQNALVHATIQVIGTRRALDDTRAAIEQKCYSIIKVKLSPLPDDSGRLKMELHLTMAGRTSERELMQLLENPRLTVALIEWEPS